MAQEKTDRQLRLEAARRDAMVALHPLLSRLDMDALMKLEAYYQQEAHNQLFSIALEERDELIGAVAKIKGARDFVQSVLRWRRTADGIITEEERRE